MPRVAIIGNADFGAGGLRKSSATRLLHCIIGGKAMRTTARGHDALAKSCAKMVCRSQRSENRAMDHFLATAI